MFTLDKEKRQRLQDIHDSFTGQPWPSEYNELFRLWGYFNSMYTILYPDGGERKQMACFALHDSSQPIWDALAATSRVENLAKQPCIGDGRDGVDKPNHRTNLAFYTLRNLFQLDIEQICQKKKCQERKRQGWTVCARQGQRHWDALLQVYTEPNHAYHIPLGATLAIVYQIRCNLFHGCKMELNGEQRKRNELLAGLGVAIMTTVLDNAWVQLL